MRNVPSLEAIKRDYAPRGVRFYFIYKALAHPETNGYVQPVSLEERLMHVREAEKRLGSTIPWLCDAMDNRAKHALGNAPNSEFIVDPRGKIVVRRVWSRPKELRDDLERLVGPVEHPTTAESLGLKPYFRSSSEKRPAELEPLELPRNLVPLVVRTVPATTPYYVKLRAEAERSLIDEGSGRLFLGFRLDPLYSVHFNNLAGRFAYEVRAPAGWQVEPARGAGPKIEAETDSAPREFLLEVRRKGGAGTDRAGAAKPWIVVVRYFACHDTDGWCKPVSHEFRVTMEADRDGGRVRRSGAGRGRPALGMPMQRPRLGPRPFRPAAGGNRIVGVVQQVDRKQRRITVRQPKGGSATYRWTDKTLMVRRGRGRITPRDITKGDPVRMEIETPRSKKGDAPMPRIIRMMVGRRP